MSRYKGLIIAGVIMVLFASIWFFNKDTKMNDCSKCGYLVKQEKDGLKHDGIDTCVAEILSISEDYHVNVFVETSASMDGYVNGEAEFKTIINKCISSIDIDENKFKYFFICSKVNDISKIENKTINRKEFIKHLTVNDFAKYSEKRGNTDMDNILDSVIQHAKDNSVSIFISDCIVSTKATLQNHEAIEELNQQTSDNIKSSIKDKVVTIYRFNSKFKGYFYDDPRNPQLNRQWIEDYRPFYIWVIGQEEYVSTITNSIRQKDLRQIKNNTNDTDCYSYCFTKPNEDIPYAITECKNGVHKKNRKTVKLAAKNTIQIGFNPVREKNKKYFRMNIDSDYILDKTNYVSTDGVSIKNIERNNGKYKDAYPYVMIISIDDRSQVKNKAEISLKYPFDKESNKLKTESSNSQKEDKVINIGNKGLQQKQMNIKDSVTLKTTSKGKNTVQSTKLSNPKGTYGIDILANGVYNALNRDDNNLFTIKIKLTK